MLIGFPLKEYEFTRLEDGKSIWVESKLTQVYSTKSDIYKPTLNYRMSYAAPEWVPKYDSDKGGILLLDDFSRADQRFIQATMELINRGEYTSWSVPKNWTILLSSNPDNGEYSVSSMDVAQKTRYLSVNMGFDLDEWAKWAEKEEIDTRCILFLMLHPELVTTEINARLITMFFNSIFSLESFQDNLNLINTIGNSSVGTEFTKLFTMFIHNKLDKVITPREIFNINIENAILRISEFTGICTNSTYKAANSSIIASRIINYICNFTVKNKLEKKHINKLVELINSDCFNTDLKFYIVKSIREYNRVKFRALMSNKDILKYIKS